MFRLVLVAAAWVVLLIAAALFFTLVIAALPGIRAAGVGALVSATWDPNRAQFGVLSFVYGTIVTSLIAIALAGPIGIAVALFLSELAPRWLAAPMGLLVELLAAVPSVIFGLWGLFVLAPLMRTVVDPFLRSSLGFMPAFRGDSYGPGLLTAGVILAIMILPTVAAISRDVFQAVPRDQREAMYALGATTWEMMTKAVLPYARSGVIGALVLALGRAQGEAVAVALVIGNSPKIVASLFAPAYTLASVVANEFSEATGPTYPSVLIALGLLLFLVSVTVNVIARLLVWSVSGGRPAAHTV